MVFSSITFLFFFLPIVLSLYYIMPFKFKNAVLLVFSLIFYAWGEPKYIVLMIFSSIVDYIHAIIIDRNRDNIKSKLALLSSIIVNLSLLFYFKYTDFFLDISNKLLNTDFELLGLALPIGISFYTFQTMSYSIDVYRGEAPVQTNFMSLATYVTLFPQLVAGPIVRYETVAHQLNERTCDFNKFYDGVYRFCMGLSKKVLLANNLGLIWEYVKVLNYSQMSILTAWIGIISFGLQIYFDFSGYSDMAIGLGKMFGFDFLENFNYPYISKSITEFWRRWHMSLGQWFRDYVYIPLGGNKKGKPIWFRNLFVVWLLTGLWHGAGINFVCWGLYFGVILMIEKLYLLKVLDKLPKVVNHIYVIVLISVSWVLFEIADFELIIEYLKAMFFNLNTLDDVSIYLITPNILLLLISILVSTPIFNKLLKKESIQFILILIGFILSVAFLVDASFNPFLYFRF